MSNYKIALIMVLILLVSFRVFAQKPKKTIVVGATEYPPLIGKKSGLMTDIVTASFASQDINVRYEMYPMSRIAWSIENHVNVASVGSVYWFEDKPNARLISSVIYYANMNFFYKKERFPDSFDFDVLREMAEYRIAYLRGGSLKNILDEHQLNVIYSADMETNIRLLERGRADFIAATDLGGWGAIHKFSKMPVTHFAKVKNNIHTISGDVLFPSREIKLKRTFDKGFETIVRSGEYQKILNKYYLNAEIPENVKSLINQLTVIN